jgi:cell division septum initiation protein DivIVA
MSSAQTMKIYSIISRIEQVLNDSPKYKLSGGNRKIVEVGELFDLLGDLKVTIPEDIRRASGIIAEESNILGDANEQADEIVNKAKADAEDLMQQAQEAAEKVYNQSVQEYEALVSEESVYREAAERAKQIQQEAIDNANTITNGSRQYADDMLADVQRYLNDYIKMLNANREELNGQVAPEYEENFLKVCNERYKLAMLLKKLYEDLKTAYKKAELFESILGKEHYEKIRKDTEENGIQDAQMLHDYYDTLMNNK